MRKIQISGWEAVGFAHDVKTQTTDSQKQQQTRCQTLRPLSTDRISENASCAKNKYRAGRRWALRTTSKTNDRLAEGTADTLPNAQTWTNHQQGQAYLHRSRLFSAYLRDSDVHRVRARVTAVAPTMPAAVPKCAYAGCMRLSRITCRHTTKQNLARFVLRHKASQPTSGEFSHRTSVVAFQQGPGTTWPSQRPLYSLCYLCKPDLHMVRILRKGDPPGVSPFL